MSSAKSLTTRVLLLLWFLQICLHVARATEPEDTIFVQLAPAEGQVHQAPCTITWGFDKVTVPGTTISEVNYNVAVAGNHKAQNKFLLLHGYPEQASSIVEDLLPQFELQFGAGNFGIIAPDLHGVNFTSPKAENWDFYVLNNMIEELKELKKFYYGGAKVFLVGHDFGANLGWHVYYLAPEMLDGYVSLSIPPPRYLGKIEPKWNLTRCKPEISADPKWTSAGDYRVAWGNAADFWGLGFLANLSAYAADAFGVKGHWKGHLEEQYASWRHEDSLKYYTRWYEAFAHYENQALLTEAVAASVGKKMPDVGYIHGDQDVIIPIAHRICCDQDSFGNVFFKFAKTTHWVQHEDPVSVVTFIKNMIEKKELQTVPEFCKVSNPSTEPCPANLSTSPLNMTIYDYCAQKCPDVARAMTQCILTPNVTADCIIDYCDHEDAYNRCIQENPTECKYLHNTPLRNYTHEIFCQLSDRNATIREIEKSYEAKLLKCTA